MSKKKENKANVINHMLRSVKIWDINMKLAMEATKDIPSSDFLRFSTRHFEIVYCIIKAKLDTITDPLEKLAYLECLDMNYGNMHSERISDALGILGETLTGAAFGVSVFVDAYGGSVYTRALLLVAILLFQGVRVFTLTTHTCQFYQRVIRAVKNDL